MLTRRASTVCNASPMTFRIISSVYIQGEDLIQPSCGVWGECWDTPSHSCFLHGQFWHGDCEDCTGIRPKFEKEDFLSSRKLNWETLINLRFRIRICRRCGNHSAGKLSVTNCQLPCSLRGSNNLNAYLMDPCVIEWGLRP
jgi:hypothetical protein